MSRTITPAMAAALSSGDLRPALFFEGEFASGFLRLWSGLGDVVWNAQTWVGAGNLMAISQIEETTDIVASGLSVTLSGVPTAFVSAAIIDAQQGLPGRVWVALRDTADAIIADPIQVMAGRLDVPTLTDSGDTCEITITYESRLIDLTKPREWRYTHESQLALYPGDVGFWYVTSLQEKEVVWGNPGVSKGK